MKLYEIINATKPVTPIIVSVPHSGTAFPPGLKKKYDKRLRTYLDDTDWFVDKLYEFAPSLGITIIKAKLSRWVIDLNRNPESVPLYNDNRLITSITPITDFFGNSLYKKEELEPKPDEITQRLELYYWPYYKKIQSLLAERKKQFGHALLWDAHSIRHKISTIQQTNFPDMILGNNDLQTADSSLIESALGNLRSSSFTVNHNSPFKGGYITRYFGKPKDNIHALQLEMNKILYMDDNEITYNQERAQKVQKVLFKTLLDLSQKMQVGL